MNKKGQIWISAVIYVLIISSTLLIVLKFGIPLIDEMKDRNNFEKTKNMMNALDEQIEQVANEGEGSQRVVTLDIIAGKLFVENNQVVWEFETDSEILDTRSSQELGNLKIVSNANVKTIELNNSYILSTVVDYDNSGNSIEFKAEFEKIGSKTNQKAINASQIIKNLTYNEVNSEGIFNMFIADNKNTESGLGYTEMIPSGNNSNLGFATIVAHINSTTSSPHFEYDLYITLNSYSDFLVIETKNIKIIN